MENMVGVNDETRILGPVKTDADSAVTRRAFTNVTISYNFYLCCSVLLTPFSIAWMSNSTETLAPSIIPGLLGRRRHLLINFRTAKVQPCPLIPGISLDAFPRWSSSTLNKTSQQQNHQPKPYCHYHHQIPSPRFLQTRTPSPT